MTLPALHNATTNKEGLYIGRKFGGFNGSDWANPFTISEDTEELRKDALWKYLQHILRSPMRFQLDELRAAPALVCWCAPKLCHGHVLLWLLTQQHFRGPCIRCGQSVESRMNMHVHDSTEILVYEQGACVNPACMHYRFHYTSLATPDTVPTWAAKQADNFPHACA
jgi:hypothetical protein